MSRSGATGDRRRFSARHREYLKLLREWSARHGMRVWAYCLMPNHVHLIVAPPSEDALCRAIGPFGNAWADWLQGYPEHQDGRLGRLPAKVA